MDSQNLYWLFSSSAQSISAFVALLLAGFTLVHTMMDTAQQKDETLEEIHTQLKRQYYRRLKVIAVLTVVAILGSLIMVYLNPYEFPYKNIIMILIFLVDCHVIIAGIAFAIDIVDPDKYKKIAEKIIEEDEADAPVNGPKVNGRQFLHEYTNLESEIRDFFEARKSRLQQARRDPASLRSLRDSSEALYENEIIDKKLYDDLQRISRYRNVVFHGRPREIDRFMLSKLEDITKRTLNTLKKYKEPRERK